MGLILFVFLLIGAALLVLPLIGVITGVSYAVSLVLGLVVVLLTLAGVAYTKLYQKTLANEAFVRTGRGGALVVLDGGTFVIPILHRTVLVSLETMRLDVERKGPDALITQDNLRVDIKAEFYIKVQANEEDILDAARSLGEKSVNPLSVGELVFEKLVSSLRSVAATKELVELHTKRNEFAEAVNEMVRSDLKANGLTLEAVTISRLDQTDTELMSDNNVFDAQGKQQIALVTQEARVGRNRIEQEAEQAVVAKNVETRKQILDLERDRARAEAQQGLEVANAQAEAKQKAGSFQIEQDQTVSERDIEKERAVQTAKAQQERDVEIVQREREVAVAQKEAERATAQAEALAREAEREKATQQIITVQVTSEADREAEKKLIAAKQVIEQDKIKDQTQADVQAYQAVKTAEGEKTAAELQYEARLRLAQADSEASKVRAEGDQAEKMVDVDVDRETVNVEQKRVEVERQSLQNKQEFSQAALEFEVQKLRVEADRETRIALAKAIGEFMSRGNYTIFGDPTTVSKMTAQYSKGLGLAMGAEGFLKGFPEEAKNAVSSAASALGEKLSGLADRVAAGKGGEGADAEDAPEAEPPQEEPEGSEEGAKEG